MNQARLAQLIAENGELQRNRNARKRPHQGPAAHPL